MRYGFIAVVFAFFAAFAAAPMPAAKADDAPKDVKGLYLMGDYPAVTLRPGETSSVNLRLQNYDMAPERLQLSVTGVPAARSVPDPSGSPVTGSPYLCWK